MEEYKPCSFSLCRFPQVPLKYFLLGLNMSLNILFSNTCIGYYSQCVSATTGRLSKFVYQNRNQHLLHQTESVFMYIRNLLIYSYTPVINNMGSLLSYISLIASAINFNTLSFIHFYLSLMIFLTLNSRF